LKTATRISEFYFIAVWCWRVDENMLEENKSREGDGWRGGGSKKLIRRQEKKRITQRGPELKGYYLCTYPCGKLGRRSECDQRRELRAM
jgi:hypothetical protein